MRLIALISSLVGGAAAMPGMWLRSSQAQLPSPISRAFPNFKAVGHDGDPGQLHAGGSWHWTPHNGSVLASNAAAGQQNCIQIQYKFDPSENGPGTEAFLRAEAVKQFYVDAWNQYAEHAFGNDSFDPLSNTGSSGSGGWGSMITDAMDTAMVMGLTDIVDRQLAWLAKQDFSRSIDQEIDIFDTTINVLAGLLSSFDLITSGLVPHADRYNQEHVKALLTGARDLADFISPVFNSPTGLPYFYFHTVYNNASGGINTAVAGTLILEWHRLSDLTRNPKYRDLADKAESYLLHPRPSPILPNLIGSNIDIETGKFTTDDAGWKSGIDSFYEYLIKTHIYDPHYDLAEEYKDFWITAVDSTERYLAVHPYGFPDVTWITELSNEGAPIWEMDDYSCFAGGNFLLGGSYLGREDFIQLGLAFTDSCHRLYNTTASGLNPLTIAWYGPNNTANDPNYNTQSSVGQSARAYYEQAGGYFVNFDENGFAGLYTLYPEPIESMMYAYRISGNSMWQDYVWEIFQAIKADAHRGDVVVSDLDDVTQPFGGGQYPQVPSYFFAETMKYMYLTFADPNLVSLDDFQFNTECHPMRIQGGTCSTPTKPTLPDWVEDFISTF